MKRFDLWKLSLLNVFAAPVRSVLTVLGFAIGVAAILAVLTLGEAGKLQVESEMNRLGIDRVWISAAEGDALSLGSGEWVSEIIGASGCELIYLSAPLLTEDGKKEQITVLGCGQRYLDNVQIEAGRNFRTTEWKNGGQSVLVGSNLASRLLLETGSFVAVGQRSYRVCGIIAAKSGVSTVPLEDSVVLPLTEAAAMTGGMIHEIQMEAPQGVSLQTAQKLALQTLKRQGIEARAQTMEVQMEAASGVIFTFVNVLKWVAMVCILVGGIGVMNIMLVSVRERRREIGVMKSMGTTPVQICALFLLEALIYGVIGGLLGIAMGLGLIHAAGQSIELTARASLNDCIMVFLCAVGMGVLFGVMPAFRASLLKCVDALRQE